MLKYCLRKWEENKEALEKDLRNDINLNQCDYAYLVRKVVSVILNGGEERVWDTENISEVGDKDRRGALLYLIPREESDLGEDDYLMTYVNYGSCCGCDTLMSIQDFMVCNGKPREKQVKGYMMLCKYLVCNIIKPYNYGWRNEDDFDRVAEERSEKVLVAMIGDAGRRILDGMADTRPEHTVYIFPEKEPELIPSWDRKFRSSLFDNTNMILLVCDMAGEEQACALARSAKKMGIATAAVAVVPFSEEEKNCGVNAQRFVENIQKSVDCIAVSFSNQAPGLGDEGISHQERQERADLQARQMIEGILNVLSKGFIMLMPSDLVSVAQEEGVIYVAAGQGSGENGLKEATGKVIEQLKQAFQGDKFQRILVHVSGDITNLLEVGDCVEAFAAWIADDVQQEDRVWWDMESETQHLDRIWWGAEYKESENYVVTAIVPG